MITYLPIIIVIILCALWVKSIYKNLNIQLELKYNKAELEEYRDRTKILEAEKIENIQKIEQLSENIKYQEQRLLEFKKIQNESNSSTKAALFDMGKELSSQLIDLHKKENKENRDISEKQISTSSQKFNDEFERIISMVGSLNKEVSQSKDAVDLIKNSLLSPSGAGALAEITLENILKASNLRSNLDYIMQYNIASTQEQDVLRPDSVIFLPSNRIMVIDAKASKFLIDSKEDDTQLAKTMNNHLRSLKSKSYAEAVRDNLSLKEEQVGDIITLMFLPTEQAIETLLDSDKDFLNKAWKNNIFPVGPVGLMNMLSFAKFQISEQLIIQNHQKIIEEVQKLILSIGTISEHSTRLGSSLVSAANHYDKLAASFNRTFLSKVRNINKLGIGSKINHQPLQRLQVINSKSDLIEVENLQQ